MNSENISKSPKRKLSLVRILSVAVILITASVYLVGEKRNSLTETCARSMSVTKDSQNTQEILDACDMLLAWFVREPAQVSLFYQQKLRVLGRKENWEAALTTAEHAISALPENETLWQLKAVYLYNVGDHAASLDALEVAADLDPKNLEVLEFRLQLSFKLRGHEGVDEVFSELIHEHDDLDWLLLRVPYEVYFQSVDFPLTHKAVLNRFFEAQKKLRVDPKNTKYRKDVIKFCRFLGPNCPPLFPEKRSSYPKMTCDAAIDRFLELYPTYANKIAELKMVPARELFVKKSKDVRAFVQVGLMKSTSELEHGILLTQQVELIVFSRLFDCVSDGDWDITDDQADGSKGEYDDEFLVHLSEHRFGPELRRNLVDLAHATPNE